MPLSGHLRELRNRIAVCVIFLVGSFLVALSFAPKLIAFLTDLGESYGYVYVYLAPQELLLQHFSVAFTAAVVVTFPVIVYEVWAFLQPGLKENENRLFLLALIFGLICFVAGVFFAYRVMIPFMLRFLIELSTGTSISASISVQSYISFLLTLFLVFGIIFELPVLSVILTQMGLLQVSWMKKGRKFMVILIFFVAAVVTPPDVVSQTMVAIPMMGLYELSIHLSAALLWRKRRAGEKEEQQ